MIIATCVVGFGLPWVRWTDRSDLTDRGSVAIVPPGVKITPIPPPPGYISLGLSPESVQQLAARAPRLANLLDQYQRECTLVLRWLHPAITVTASPKPDGTLAQEHAYGLTIDLHDSAFHGHDVTMDWRIEPSPSWRYLSVHGGFESRSHHAFVHPRAPRRLYQRIGEELHRLAKQWHADLVRDGLDQPVR